jgi:hypothetical protein
LLLLGRLSRRVFVCRFLNRQPCGVLTSSSAYVADVKIDGGFVA